MAVIFSQLRYRIRYEWLNKLDWTLRLASIRRNKSVLVVWNRGLGDILLSLCAVFDRIRTFLPGWSITVLTRSDLVDGFRLIGGVRVLKATSWVRKGYSDVDAGLMENGMTRADFGVVLFENMDPNKWIRWQLGRYTPRVPWSSNYDDLYKKFSLPLATVRIGAHVNTETGKFYRNNKDWPMPCWSELISRITDRLDAMVVVFGFRKDNEFSGCNRVIDLRGETSLFDVLSIVKNWCSIVVAPDAGILNYVYYLDVHTGMKVISLWGDHKTGLIRQAVASPNKLLIHYPVLSARVDGADDVKESPAREIWGGSDRPGNIADISVDQVFDIVYRHVGCDPR